MYASSGCTINSVCEKGPTNRPHIAVADSTNLRVTNDSHVTVQRKDASNIAFDATQTDLVRYEYNHLPSSR